MRRMHAKEELRLATEELRVFRPMLSEFALAEELPLIFRQVLSGGAPSEDRLGGGVRWDGRASMAAPRWTADRMAGHDGAGLWMQDVEESMEGRSPTRTTSCERFASQNEDDSEGT